MLQQYTVTNPNNEELPPGVLIYNVIVNKVVNTTFMYGFQCSQEVKDFHLMSLVHNLILAQTVRAVH